MKAVLISGLAIMLLSQKVAIAQCTPQQIAAMRNAGMAESQIQAACPSSSQCTPNQVQSMLNAGMSKAQIKAACNSPDTGSDPDDVKPPPDFDCLNKCIDDVRKCYSDLITSDPYGTFCDSIYQQCQMKCNRR